MKTKLFAFALFLTFSTSANNRALPITIGYLIVVESKTEGFKVTRTMYLADVYTEAEIQFPNNCVDFATELNRSVFYEISNRNKTFYVEVKRVTNTGKFRRLSNRQFREIVQMQNLASPDTKTATNQNN